MRSTVAGMTPREWRSLGALCGMFSLRMLGIFLLLPVLSPYALQLNQGEKGILIGLAMGAFPLTQTVLQVPFGLLSDRFGRKPVIAIGLMLFAAGSFWAGSTRSIGGLIGALMLQGSGAVASVIVALAADLTRDEVRTRAMAVIGGSVGLSFGMGFVFGPILKTHMGVPFIFQLIGVLSVGAIGVLLFLVPTPSVQTHKDEVQITTSRVHRVLSDANLWRANTGIFLLNGTLRALFVLFPLILARLVPENQTWLVYLCVLGASGLVMFPVIFLSEKKGYIKQALMGSLILLIAGLCVFGTGTHSLYRVVIALGLYFMGFSILEAILPSMVTRLVSSSDRGTAMGLFNMSQYMGAFVGSLVGGLFLRWNPAVMFYLLAVLSVLWLWYAAGLTTEADRVSAS